jgi:hypothetical protein
MHLLAVPLFAAALAQEDLPALPAPEDPPATAPPAASEETAPPVEPKADEKYVPHGFTIEVGLGISFMSSSSSQPFADHSAIGLAPLSLSLGGFLSPQFALMGRIAGTSFFRETVDGRTYQIGNTFVGPELQWWPSERIFLAGGVGLGLYGTNALQDVPKDYQFNESGLGFDARAGWVFAVGGKQHAFGLVAEFVPTFTKQSTVMGSALNLQWQFL